MVGKVGIKRKHKRILSVSRTDRGDIGQEK
jgi:hypothetical protein